MKPIRILSAGAMALALVACGGSETTAQENRGSAPAVGAPEASAQVHTATGEVTGISGDRVTIAHGPVETIGWPSMTMGFRAASPDMVRGIGVGDSVAFEFREAGGDYELTSLGKAR